MFEVLDNHSKSANVRCEGTDLLFGNLVHSLLYSVFLAAKPSVASHEHSFPLNSLVLLLASTSLVVQGNKTRETKPHKAVLQPGHGIAFSGCSFCGEMACLAPYGGQTFVPEVYFQG